jgi:hypothetical protein
MNAKDKLDDLSDLFENHSRALTTKSDTRELVADDGFAAAAADADRNLLKGELIKFVDGFWSIGGTPIPPGMQYVPERLAACWVRWDDKKPVQYEWPRPSGMLPHRDTLSHADESKWPEGIDGEPSDPWRNTRYFWLVNTSTAETYTYTNSTTGTRLAYEALGRAVATMRKVHKHALPVVELSSTTMKTRRGTKQRPHFQIVGWKGVGGPPQIQPDMNDELPL